MTWFLLTLTSIVLWSITDILLKVSLNTDDALSHYKAFVWIGITMALAGGIMSNWSTTLANSAKLLMNDLLFLIPLGVAYAAATFMGLFGKKHLSASIVSPLENVDGAMSALIIYFYYLITGYIHPSYGFDLMDVIGIVVVVVGIIMLGSQEQALFKQEFSLEENKKKHRFGALALFFPLIYNLVDVFSVAGIDTSVSSEGGAAMPAIDFFILECAGFAVLSIFVWLYMWIVKKHCYNPFQEEEWIRCGAATSETFGTMTFILASGINPILTGPATSLYCLVTIVLARLFLKERLTKKQYISLAFVVLGIALLGISDIIKG